MMSQNMFFNTGIKGIKERVIQDGIYIIAADDNFSKVMSIAGKSVEPESPVIFSKKTKESHQFFFIKYINSNNCYTIMPLNSHLYLGVMKIKDSNYNHSLIMQNKDMETYIIYWNIIFDDGYSFQLEGSNYNLQYNKETNNVSLKVINNSQSQKFYIKTIEIFSSGLYYICSLSPDKYYVSFSKEEKQKQSYLKKKNKLDDQLFYIIFDEIDGCYSIINYNNLECLSSELKQADYYNLDNQKWIFGTNDLKTYYITLKSDCSLLCNSISRKADNRNLCLKTFQNKYAFNCDFQLEPYNKDSLLTKLLKYAGCKNKSIQDSILQIKERIAFRHSIQILESDLSRFANEKINSQLFSNSYNLIYLEIHRDIIDIDDNALSNCFNIKSIKCNPKWLKLLPNPINIENIIVPEGVESIEQNSFNEVKNLKYLSLPHSLKCENCDQNIFKNINGLKIFKGDPSFLRIIQKDELIKIIIPFYVKVIPEKICFNCKSLREVHIEYNNSLLETIEPKAFAGCKLLRFVSPIPEKVGNISPNSFKGCKLYDFKLKNEIQEKSMVKKLIIKPNIMKITDEYTKYINITKIEIPISVQECEENILNSFKKLKKVKCHPKWLNCFNTNKIEVISIPDQIRELKKCDFVNLHHLKLVKIPESIEKVEDETFKNCKELFNIKCGIKHLKYLNKMQIKSIWLNEQVKSINETDFEEFINLESCKINENTKEISPKAFINCKKLMSIDHPYGNSLINNSISIDESKDTIYKKEFEDWTNLKSLVIPESIKQIEKDAFKDCVNIEYLTCDPKWFPFIPKDSIRKIVIPSFVKEIKKGQFDEFNSLIYIKLPQEIIISDPTIFDSCEYLKTIRCKSSTFNQFSDKTIIRCNSRLKMKYENPIFNFQPDESKIFDETELILSDNTNFSSSFYCSFKSCQNRDKSMNIDRLVVLDGYNVNPYKDEIKKVLQCIKSDEVTNEFNSKDTNILEISKVCANICNKIFKKLNITPKVVQIYAILRLANEILNESNSKGSIGEIKPGEGKSLIVAILSIILIKYNRTIDIITSNLECSRLYKDEQTKFFDLFNISTSILEEEITDSNLDLFGEYDHMACFNLEAFNCPVVYSTNRNFEYYYLNILFSMKSRKREFDVVLTDDIDNMLIDELYSPTTILKEINYASSADIFFIVFASRSEEISMIKYLLKKHCQGASDFNDDEVELLKAAALEAFNKKENVDYIVENKQIIIIDHDNGCRMPYSYWPIYLLQMVEIKESILPRPVALPMCQIARQEYFKLYKKIVGITGTLGSESDEKKLKKTYKLNTFKVPPDLPFEVEIYYKNRPDSIDEIFDLVQKEISEELVKKKRPVLVIWDSQYNASKFLNSINYQNVRVIFRIDPKFDKETIENIGKLEFLTITTSFAIKNIDLILTKEALNEGGLHIVIPMKISNIRSLEKHVSMIGKQGQPGSVTIFISKNDLYLKTLSFEKDINLNDLQNRFAKRIKDSFSWMLCGKNKNDFGNSMIPFAANYGDIFNIFTRQLYLILKEITTSNEIDIFQDLSWLIVQTAWRSFFTNIQNDKLYNCNKTNCQRKYNRFIAEMNDFFPIEESKNAESALNFLLHKFNSERNNEYMFYDSYKISDSDVVFIPPKNVSTDSIQNQEKESFYNKIKSNFIWMKKKYDENKAQIPCKMKITKTPQIEINIFDIDFIKMTIILASEAYDGHFSIGRVIFASEANDICKPKFYCIEHLNMLFVVTRGTKSDEDWITDFMCNEVCQVINGETIYFHEGFLAASYCIFNEIIVFLERDYEKVFFVGHSYAAAVSNVLCLLTKSNSRYKDKNIFSLAFAPPPSMSKIPAYISDCMFSFINKNDIVPHLSLNNIKNTLTLSETSIKKYLEYALSFLKSIKFAFELANRLAEFIEKSKTQLYSILDSVDNDFHVQKNIGNIFHIGLSRSIKLRKYQVDETDLNKVLFFTQSMLSDHYINEYISSFDIIKEY